MSEPYRDPYPRTPIVGAFFKNLHGDDALKQLELAAAVEVPAAPQPEHPVAVVDEPSVPVVEESSVDASAAEPQSDASPEPPAADAPLVEPVVPSAEVPAV